MLIRDRIHQLSDQVSIPRHAIDLLSGKEDEKTASQKLIHVIESDPVLMAKVLAVANSAFYGLRWEVGSAQQAVMTLGVDEINRVVMAYQLKQQMHSVDPKHQEYLSRLWKHSVVTAALSRLIRQYIQVHTNGEEFTGGILHDFGKILLVHHFPKELDAARVLTASNGLTDIAAERSVLGIDHAEIGGILAEHWELPKQLQEIIARHHSVDDTLSDPLLVSIVRFADLLSERWEHGVGEQAIPADLDREPCWKVLQQRHPDLAGMHALDLDKPLYAIFESSREFIGMFL